MKRVATAAAFAIAVVAVAWFLVRTDSRGNAARDASAVTSVDALFAPWSNPGSPGCAVGVSRNGLPIFERGYGMANVELGVPITPDSVFHVASVSKQFTAMSILLLARQGRLSLDDEVWKYIPEWTDRSDHVTIRHLLNHTGGLRDAFVLLSLAGPRDDNGDVNGALVRMLARQRSLNTPPGAEFSYSNSGYALLAVIVKRASGQSLRAFANANIFQPLGMTRTHVHDDPAIQVPNRALGYHVDARRVHPAVHADLGHLVGTTGLLTTAHDLLIWEQNFAKPRIGDTSIVEAMQTPTVEAPGLSGSGETPFYGYGLEIGRDQGLRTIGHAGGDPGYAAYVVRYPDRQLAVAVLCNMDNVGASIGELATNVAHAFLDDKAGGAGRAGKAAKEASGPAAIAAMALSAEELAKNVGLYRDGAQGTYGRILLRAGKLMAVPNAGEDPTVELVPVAATRFLVRGTTVSLEFVPSSDGQTRELRINGVGPKPSVLKRVTSGYAPSGSELRAFAGTYTSAELDATYSLIVRGSDLVVQIPGRAGIVLQPIFPDAFYGPIVEVVECSRDARGRVTGFEVNAAGVRHLRFDRAPLLPK